MVYTRSDFVLIRNAYLRAHPHLSSDNKSLIRAGQRDDDVNTWEMSENSQLLYVQHERSNRTEKEKLALRQNYLKQIQNRVTRALRQRVLLGDDDYNVFLWATKTPEPSQDYILDEEQHDSLEEYEPPTHYTFYNARSVVLFDKTAPKWGDASQIDRMKKAYIALRTETRRPRSIVILNKVGGIVVKSFTGRRYTYVVSMGFPNRENPNLLPVAADNTFALEGLIANTSLIKFSRKLVNGKKRIRCFPRAQPVPCDCPGIEPVSCSCDDFWYRYDTAAKFGCKHIWFLRMLLFRQRIQ